jgi:hypothetical protein
MKKNPAKLLKPLRLRKEVLKTLSTDQLVQVGGGNWEGYDSFAGCTRDDTIILIIE